MRKISGFFFNVLGLRHCLNNSWRELDLNPALSFFRTQIHNPHGTLPHSMWAKTVNRHTVQKRSEQEITVGKRQLWQSCGQTNTFLGRWRLYKCHQDFLEETERVLQWVQENYCFWKPTRTAPVMRGPGPGPLCLSWVMGKVIPLVDPQFPHTQKYNQTKQNKNDSSLFGGFCKD